jgi:hypothetical protein
MSRRPFFGAPAPKRSSGSRFALPRRTILRGLALGSAAAVGLPLLEAMLDGHGEALADGEELPTRFVTWFFGNGVRLDQFEPAQAGALWNLSSELEPLAAVKEYVTVCTGLMNRCEVLMTHHEGMTAFNGYTMDSPDPGALFSKAGGPTIDQVIADVLVGKTPTNSIQMGVSKRKSIMDSGTTMGALSHRGPNQPLNPEFNPQRVWTTLFGEFIPRPDDRSLRASVLDAVKQDATALRDRLGQIDRERLENHLEAVRALELKIQSLPPECEIPELPEETNDDIAGDEPIVSVNRAMSDLMVHAFKCDVTRVASLFFLGGASETVFSDLDQNVGHHLNTHDEGGSQPNVHAGVIYIMRQFAYLLERMKAEVDATGKNLLDTSIVFASSDCAEGVSHTIERQPIILVGHGREKLRYPGIHYQASPRNAPAQGNTTDVLLTVARCFDRNIPSIGAGAPMSTTIIPTLTGLEFES